MGTTKRKLKRFIWGERMKKYAIICNEGTSMWDYTHEEPLTRKELIEKFWDYAENEGFETPKKAFSLNYIRCIWNVSFEVIK